LLRTKRRDKFAQRKKRYIYNVLKRVAILKDHLLNQDPISVLCDEVQLLPRVLQDEGNFKKRATAFSEEIFTK
jgi:hypothetical protein